MSSIISVGTSDAKYKLPQSEVKEFVNNLFSNSGANIERMISVFDNSTVEERHFCAPMEWFKTTHSFPERNKLFIENALNISEEAVNKCLEKAGIEAADVDQLIFVSTTGISTPSMDAMLINRMKFKMHIKRTPIWGLGCAGGAAGLSRAMDFTKAYPDKICLVAAVELCSLTFQKDDLTKSNIVATSLFSDGCAAVLVGGSESKIAGKAELKLNDSLSTLYYDSLDVMGWEIVEQGFRVIFSRDIPTIVKDYVYPNIQEMLDEHNLSLKDVKHYVTHPGGLKVINAYEESLGITNGAFNNSRKVLREHGNMSSPSVLYVLNEFINEHKYSRGEKGLISALGPGFSSEIILFEAV
jgi:alkylresorcinol/alkylpyrone synthase